MDSGTLHIVMLPWLALGHLLPFLELSKRMARKGHRVSFVSTPKNIQRLLPKIPPNLTPLFQLVEFPLPIVEHLPCTAEATVDLPSDNLRPYLRIAYDALDRQLSAFLHRAPPPDWIIFDYAAHWVPGIAARAGVPCAYLSLFNAWTLAFFGPPSVLRGDGGARTAPEDFTQVPDWVPLPSTIAYRAHEARELFEPGVVPDASGVSESCRFAAAIDGCQFVAIRSCNELEPDWLHLVGELYKKPVVPVGLFPPSSAEEEQSSGRWAGTYEFLGDQEPGSVVYAAFGSEAKLTSAQVKEIALGLELSGLPFVWALRADWLPEGFENRTEGRGIVCKDWVPQIGFLSHPSIGGFLTHGGWNSIVEGLALGVPMVILPLVFDQGLNARSLVERGIGVEVPRDEEDGSFTADGIAESLSLAMVEENGARLRDEARKCKEMFGDEELHDKYVGDFLKYLWDCRQEQSTTRGRIG